MVVGSDGNPGSIRGYIDKRSFPPLERMLLGFEKTGPECNQDRTPSKGEGRWYFVDSEPIKVVVEGEPSIVPKVQAVGIDEAPPPLD